MAANRHGKGVARCRNPALDVLADLREATSLLGVTGPDAAVRAFAQDIRGNSESQNRSGTPRWSR